MNCPQRYFTKQYVACAIAVFTVVVVGISFTQSVYAATGINRTINFQGKLVDSNGLNVADSTYSVVFSIYDRTSSGTTLWTETQSVTTVDGIFRVALGSSTPIPTSFNFNWDGVYLGMKVGADSEMTPRIRMAAVPYAFNAEKVAGLTVTDENGVASTSGTLKIPNGKTISFGGAFTTTAGNDLTFTTSGNSTLSLGGSGSLTLVDTTTAQTLTGKIIGSGGLTFTGATTDITTGTNQDFTIVPNGTGLLGIGTTTPASFLHVYGGSQGGNALAIFDQRGASTNDIFTASSAGLTKFVIGNSGNVGIGTTLTSSYNLDVTGTARFTGAITVASCTGCSAGASQWTTTGNSIYYSPVSGGVGVGTTSPATLLHIYDTRGGNASLIVDQRGTNTPDILTGSASGTFKFVFNNEGNLGIGNNVPTRKLAISIPDASTGLVNIQNQFGEILDITGAGAVTFGNSGNNNSGGLYNFGVGGAGSYVNSAAGDYLSINAGSNNVGRLLNVQQNSSSKFLILANGNVGIGTTTVNSLLDIRGSTITNNALMTLVQNGTADIFTASAGATTRFTINNNGNIGIGTSRPSSTLYLNGTTTGNAALTVVQNTATGDIFTASAGAVTKFVIDRSGNVGIGSSLPSGFNLDVTGTARFTGAITVASCTGCSAGASQWTTTGSNIYFNTGNVGIGNHANATTPIHLLSIAGTTTGNAAFMVDQRTATGDLLTASAAGSTKFVINRSGNVGIGSTTPTASLDLLTPTLTSNGATGALLTSLFSPSAGGIQRGLAIEINNSPITSANTARGMYTNLIDDTDLSNILYGSYTSVALGGNGGKTGYGAQYNVTDSSISSGNVYGINLDVSRTGDTDSVSNGTYGMKISAQTVGAATLASQNIYGIDLSSGSQNAVSGTVNDYGIYIRAGFSNIGAAGTLNHYGMYINGQSMDTTGTTSNTGLYVGTATGADTNYAAIFAGGSIGMGTTAPTSQLNVTRALARGATGKALVVFDQIEKQDIFAASSSGVNRFVISQNGNVGIGTALPGSALTVNGTTTGNAALTVVQNTATGDILSASAGAVTKFVVDRGGNVGIGTSIATGAKLVVSESSAPAIDMTQIVNSTGTSTTGVDGLQIDFKTAGSVASTDNSGLKVNVTSGNAGATTTLEGITIGDLTGAQANATETALKIGTGWDVGISVASGGITVSGGGLTLSGASGMTYSGSARPTKTLILSAEYPGATLTASGSATITGNMTSDASPSASFGAGTNNWMNYYMWTSTQTVLHDYTIAVRATVPKDFSAWNTTAMQVNFDTALTTSNTNKLDVLVYRAANATATPLFYSQANVSSTVKQWKTVDVPSSALSTLVAGDSFVIYLKLYAKDSNYVQVGDIVLSYLAAF